MAVKTEFSERELAAILANYNLGDYRASQPLVGGTVQTNYRVQTTQGDFVFRYYENRPRESVLFEVQVIRYIRKRNFPCPTPFSDKHGQFVGQHRQKPFVVFEFIDGQPIADPNSDQREALLKKAAELQQMTRNYRPSYRKFRWNYTVSLCEQLAQKEAERIGDDNARAKLRWVRNALANLWLPRTLPKGVCHCDFHFSNVLFRNGDFVALLDFDDANYTFLAFDLVSMIDEWAWPHDPEGLNFAEARAIAQTYQQYRELAPSEKWHVYDIHKLQIMFDCIWFFGRGQAEDFYERKKIEFLDRLDRESYYAMLLS